MKPIPLIFVKGPMETQSIKKTLVMFMVVITFSACKKETSDSSALINGKWNLIERKHVDDHSFNDMADYEFNDTYTITDNSFSIDFGNDEEQENHGIHTYSYTYSNNKIILKNSDYYQYFEVMSISASELRLRPYYKDTYDNPKGEISNLSVDYEVLTR